MIMHWYKKSQTDELQVLRQKLKTQYPGLELDLWKKNNNSVELASIEVPQELRNQGIGTDVIQQIKDYAQKNNLSIVLRPEPNKGKKGALDRFYRRLDFIPNKGRNMDYTLSAPFAKTMYWKPKE